MLHPSVNPFHIAAGNRMGPNTKGGIFSELSRGYAHASGQKTKQKKTWH